MEFLQENLVGDLLPPSRKITTSYSNLYRAINCLVQKLSSDAAVENENENSDDETQQFCDF